LIFVETLDVTWPNGRQTRQGSGSAPKAHIPITDVGRVRALCLRPVLALGQGYTDGTLQVPTDQPFDLLAGNEHRGGLPGWYRITTFLRGTTGCWLQRNTPQRSRRAPEQSYPPRSGYGVAPDLSRSITHDNLHPGPA
jgi:cyclopropane-fatty-acyl-phospholipid synthase